MKRKVRCIYIDGVERSGKTSISREIRRFLKERDKDLFEIDGTDGYANRLQMQEANLEDNNSFVLKEGSLMDVFYNDIRQMGCGPQTLSKRYNELLRKERDINHKFGVVHFFLLPEDHGALKRMFGDEVPEYMDSVLTFYKDINQYNLAQGLDIVLISFDEFDRIYDVRDKIFDLLEKNYEI